MEVIQMPLKIQVIADDMFPKTPLPNGSLLATTS
jgi:hypothetical protein